LSSSAQDDAIALYSKSGNGFQLMPGGLENASSGSGDVERLNYTGLTVGQLYYISVGSPTVGTGGPFSLCIQNLMPSGCATAVPAGGLGLCDAYRATYRGAPSQGVSYTFHFNGTGGGASGLNTLSGTNGLCVLSNPALGLRYGGVYAASVDVDYALSNSNGVAEPIEVVGASSGLCSSVTMRTQPNVEVKSSQRCPATLLRSNWLIGAPVVSTSRLCAATSYTYEFTQIVGCADATVVSVLPAEYTTTSASPYLGLGVLQNLPSTGIWSVKMRPNFSYGPGVYGPAQRIQVVNTSAGAMLPEGALEGEERTIIVDNSGFMVYPNPSEGNAIQVQLTDLQSNAVSIRLIDATGRLVLEKQFSVEGSLNTSFDFAEPLQNGIYMIECLDNDRVKSQRLVIQH
jgi:hypothetical protein